jgi:hypothetical protein
LICRVLILAHSHRYAIRPRLGTGLQREGRQEIQKNAAARQPCVVSRPATRALFRRKWIRLPLLGGSTQASLQTRQTRHGVAQHRPRRHTGKDMESYSTLVSDPRALQPWRVADSTQDSLIASASGVSLHNRRSANEAYCLTVSDPTNSLDWLFRRRFIQSVLGSQHLTLLRRHRM